MGTIVARPTVSSGDKKYPYANHKLVTLLNGQKAVTEMNLLHRVMAALIIALACAVPDFTAACEHHLQVLAVRLWIGLHLRPGQAARGGAQPPVDSNAIRHDPQ